VTKSTRDELLKFLSNFDKTKGQNVTVRPQQNQTSTENETFDMSKAEGLKEAYSDIIQDLNNVTKTFQNQS